jgi:hypothetical protein
MNPDDRVMVGVINRRQDVEIMLQDRWYRIPQDQMPKGVYVEYLAFFLSGAAAKAYGSSGVHFYAERRGIELLYRRDLLPDEPQHKHAHLPYYMVRLGEPIRRDPPILNPTKRRLSFIYTTWDRFFQARELNDLYSTADYYVDRIYHALRDAQMRVQHWWEVGTQETTQPAAVRILCERGVVTAAFEGGDEVDIRLDLNQPEDEILAQIKARIYSKGGPLTINIPPVW